MEVQAIVPKDFRLLTLDDIGFEDDIPEPYDTLEENARHKAITIFEKHHVAVFAEDSGLFVTALNGRPGVYSARYAGDSAKSEDNILLLLSELGQSIDRSAYFKTVIAYVDEKGEHFMFEGVCEGRISTDMIGDDGFGYDPVFIPQGESKCFAEMQAMDKHAISHRKKAMDQFLNFLLVRNAL